MPKHSLGRPARAPRGRCLRRSVSAICDQSCDQVMGKWMGMMGNNALSAAPKTAADLERTTGFEPATLTLAR